MIKVENISVMNFENAIRGCRNPMNSWNRSDSAEWSCDALDCCECIKCIDDECQSECGVGYMIGSNDLDLMKRLYKGGAVHRKYLRQIFVSMDITAPLYWWKEMDQYRVGVTTNSCSTMHRLMSKPFEMSDFSFDKLSGYKADVTLHRPIVDEDMVAEEQWKVWDNDYDVSNYGRVKHKLKNKYRIIAGSTHKDGYVFVTLHNRQIPVHRLVGKLFLADSYKDGLVINHRDGNKQNNFSTNLEWVTQSENVKHSVENNLTPKGLSTYKGKLSSDEREHIKAMWDSGQFSKRDIACRYKVSHTTINAIINDKYKYANKINLYEEIARPTVDILNELRDSYLGCTDEVEKKKIWYAIIQMLPSSFNQRRTITMTYENIMNMIDWRENHKLDEWVEFVKILYKLPYVSEIRGK